MDSPNVFVDNPLLHVSKASLESALIESETLSYGLRSTRYSATVFTASGTGGLTIGFRRAASTATSVVADEICADKSLTKSLLQTNNLPTAIGQRMPRAGINSSMNFIKRHGWPVVVKPLRGSGGRGVTANIDNEVDLRDAIPHADSPSGFLIEKHVPGDDFRFLVVGDTVAGVWVRDAANVVGDGEADLDSLIDSKNAIRAQNPHLSVRPIPKSELVLSHLKRSGKDLSYVPAKGEKVYLRSAANLSSGGDNVELTDETHPSLKAIAVAACQALPGTELAGVDMLLSDHRAPADTQTVNICEINGRPGISAHDYPMYGPPRRAAKAYVERLAGLQRAELGDYRASGAYDFTVVGRFNGSKYLDHLANAERAVGAQIEGARVSGDTATFRVVGTALAAAVVDAWAIGVQSSRIAVPRASVVDPVSPGD